jgi:hypothetical protein
MMSQDRDGVNNYSLAHGKGKLHSCNIEDVSSAIPPRDEQAQAFLQAVFAHKLPDDYILIWDLPHKSSRFFREIGNAVDHVHRISADYDVYFGCGLHNRIPPRGRGTERNIKAITSLWVEFDIADEAHTERHLPPDLETVLQLLADFTPHPSVVVDSGHGCHAYWLLRDLLAPSTDLVHRLQGFFRNMFKSKVWKLDATHDITRVLRVPGTQNRKREPRKDVTIVWWHPARRYTPDDFAWLPEVPDVPIKPAASTVPLPSGLPPLPHEKFQTLYEHNYGFALSWERQKKLPSGKQSASEWDLSITVYAVAAGWTDAEIASLILEYRTTKHRVGFPNHNVADYLARTIRKARQDRR